MELYNGSQVETVSIGRAPRPASQTAENVTVVTAKDIEALNAHTLADVLNLVPGVQLEFIRTPGTVTNIFVQGSNYNHILVLIDNVPINNLADNFPDISSVTVQMIDRIEIVKGAASSSWGNALGGVINVITKNPQTERPTGGTASVSGGKAATIDGRGEVTGTVHDFGYYLTGGKLRSDGLEPNNGVDLNHFYGKVRYDLPNQGFLVATGWLSDNSQGQTQISEAGINANSDVTQYLATLSAQYPLTDRFTIDAMFRTRHLNSDVVYSIIDNGVAVQDTKDQEHSYGGVFKVSYLDDLQRLVAGVDYDYMSVHLSQPLRQADISRPSDDRIGVYLNDTFTLGRFAVTPSVRYDHSRISGNQFSPSFGITYALTDNSVVRGYTAKGYSITSLTRSDSLEDVWTSQVGIESADVPYLWLKGTLFRNETGDITHVNSLGVKSKQRQLKQGVEVEARTTPVFFTSLSLGYTYIDAKDRDTDAVLQNIPKHTLDLGVKYEDKHHLRLQLTGHYINWNLDTETDSQYRSIIWDLHLGKRFDLSENLSIELFGSIRNLFNGHQYDSSLFKNPGRWAEGGIRCAF
ncbi:TonB-dependent receptor plug domain-containing protein [Geomonas sp.]|uniref:TonB-dependent receptor plug domain-containing protein n=1 Tax=Geomonas sp. TaxID=2651584 RepID=UPI002B4A7EC7|nr:TonB-dependent receptor [Geomonas sp.]HJV35296.1 TonB-dependent receptor [Geomonas sp.]